MDNIVMHSVINVHNYGTSKLELESFSEKEMQASKQDLLDRGYDCRIEQENNKTYLVLARKDD